MNILGNNSEMYGNSTTFPLCPSVTRWQCYSMTLQLHFENFLDALSTSQAKQKEAEALGLFIQGPSCQIIDIFKSIKPLILFFQRSKGACSVSDANTYHELGLQSLKELIWL